MHKYRWRKEMENSKLKYWGSWKGRVIKAIAIDGAKSYKEIKEATGLGHKSLKRALGELYDNETVYDTKKNSQTKQYRVKRDLYYEYKEYFENDKSSAKASPNVKIPQKVQDELLDWIKQWQNLKGLTFDLEKQHFFLEGRYLDDLSKEVIFNAKKEVLLINPYIRDCDLSNTLRDSAKKKVKVTTITRPPATTDAVMTEYHSILRQDKVLLYTNKKVHAKIIVVDRALAIISSMNFIPQSSGGQSWEAGLITVDSDTIDDVVNSILRILEMPESVVEQST